MRVAERMDHWHIMDALLRLKAKANGRGQMKFTVPHVAAEYLFRQIDANRVVIHEGYAIMYDVGTPWYTDRPFLIEDIIIKVYPTTSPVSVAIDCLEAIARSLNLTAVVAGDTQIGYMTPHYLAAGYTTLGTQLFKELPDGIRSQDHGRSGAD